jgi:hypothetical protein
MNGHVSGPCGASQSHPILRPCTFLNVALYMGMGHMAIGDKRVNNQTVAGGWRIIPQSRSKDRKLKWTRLILLMAAKILTKSALICRWLKTLLHNKLEDPMLEAHP